MATPEPMEKSILLRIPANQLMLLDAIVKNSKGKFKSRNDLVISILDNFFNNLKGGVDLELRKKGGS